MMDESAKDAVDETGNNSNNNSGGPKMKYCTNCGRLNPENERYCGYCGKYKYSSYYCRIPADTAGNDSKTVNLGKTAIKIFVIGTALTVVTKDQVWFAYAYIAAVILAIVEVIKRGRRNNSSAVSILTLILAAPFIIAFISVVILFVGFILLFMIITPSIPR